MKLPKIAIIILHYKNLADTRECLESLKKIDYPNYSIIVVNNDSPEDGQKLQDEFGDFINLIQNKENLGFSEGNNVGIRAALADERVDAVLILNNDTVVEPNFLSEMAKIDAGMVAPRLLNYNNRDKIDNLGVQLMSSGLPFNRTDENHKLFCPSGGCALYTRELLEAIDITIRHPELVSGSVLESYKQMPKPSTSAGRQVRHDDIATDAYYFDPLFFAYCEDIDLGFRARLLGFTAAYATKAIVYHKGSAATSKMSDFAVYHTYRNLLWTQFKNFPALLLLWQSPWLGAGWFFIIALYLFKGRPGVILRAFSDGVPGLRFILSRRQQVQRNRKVTQKQIISWFSSGLFPKKFLDKNKSA